MLCKYVSILKKTLIFFFQFEVYFLQKQSNKYLLMRVEPGRHMKGTNPGLLPVMYMVVKFVKENVRLKET
jgi:hypothetical protein